MHKKRKLQNIEFHIKKAEELLNFLPNSGAAHLAKAKKDYDKLYGEDSHSKDGCMIFTQIQSLSKQYVNLY